MNINRLLLAVFAVSLWTSTSHAQETPKADLAVAYSQLFLPKGFTLTLNGGSVALAVHVHDWLGIVSDLGAYNGSPGIQGLVGATYTFGPRFSYRKWDRLTPFAQAVFGGGHANSTNGGFLGARNAVAFGGGGGGEVGIDHAGKFALRGQLEFINFRTNHNLSPDANTGAIRLSVGLVYRIGRK